PAIKEPDAKTPGQPKGTVAGWKRRFMGTAANEADSTYDIHAVSTVWFHPRSFAILIWNTIYALSIVFLGIYIPLCLSCTGSFGSTLPAVSVFGMLIVCLDRFIQCNTAYCVDQQLETDPRMVRLHYLKRGRWIMDIVVAFPWVFVADAVASQQQGSSDALRLVSVINALPIIMLAFDGSRVSYIGLKFDKLIRSMGINLAMIDSLKIMLSMFFYWHWNACSVMYLQKLNQDESLLISGSEWDQYSFLVFAAAAEMLANGWGVPLPTNTKDRWLKILNMIVSALFLALFIGNISAFMIGLDR
ncbi:Potassium voltage-gated channel sub H member 7, partial [Kappamyces sp. JEL0680]